MVDPRHQSGLVTALNERFERFTRTYPGFIRASLHVSEDQQRVLSHVLWRSKSDCEKAFENAEQGEGDLAAFIHGQFANLDQPSANHIAAQTQQLRGMNLVVVAEAIGRTQQGIFDLLPEVRQAQVIGLDHAIAANQQRVMDNVFQLTDIAGPAVGAQLVLRLAADLDRPAAQTLAVDLDEVTGQRHDVAWPFTQGAQLQIDHLDLDRQGQVADFVEKQRAAVGFFEPAGLGGQRAGECALLMTEQLGFHQRFGECTAVHRHERLMTTAAEVVHVTRDQFLARARFANDEDAGIARRHLLDM
nr:hypothetical protein [Tanacetum cinerariifolium]